jgi:hypothetical protein
MTLPGARSAIGLEIANRIGRRKNTDVIIQRRKKLTCRVKLHANRKQNYSKACTRECPDFSVHCECKRIHAVKFSKLHRKKIYCDIFANIPITESMIGENILLEVL